MTIILLLSLFVMSTVFASGSRSGGSGGFSSGSSSRSARTAEDITYDYGKSIFTGRNIRYGRIKYCVPKDANNLSKVKKSTLKPFVGGLAEDFTNSLYNCDNPGQRIDTVMRKADLSALVFYLNKRYKLRLN